MTDKKLSAGEAELLPCPFCGSPAGRATKKATWLPSRHRVACTNSGCGAHYGYWHPLEWNRRAALSQQPECCKAQSPDAGALVEALTEILACDWRSCEGATDFDISAAKGNMIRKMKDTARSALAVYRAQGKGAEG